ncbi:MAG: branched-chain amino acid ABC transporter permease [Xanthobacteraceae bacterium]
MGLDTRLLILAFAVLALASVILPGWAINLLTLMLARALVILGLLVLWRTGLVSFGQALYYGLGAYAVGLVQKYTGLRDAFALLLVGTLAALVTAVLLGFLLRRYRDIFFAMLSLAFSMILYGTLVKSETLGSTDGFAVAVPHFLFFAPAAATAKYALLLLTIAVAAAAAVIVQRYLASPMGHLAVAIRDNEVRVEYLGFPVSRAVHVKYVLAGALAGAGGALVALSVGHIDPEMTYWTTSGEFVFIAILAGTGSVAAPFLGSGIFEVLRTAATEYAPYSWQMVLGVALLLVILFLPDGLWSLFRRGAGAFSARRPAPGLDPDVNPGVETASALENAAQSTDREHVSAQPGRHVL